VAGQAVQGQTLPVLKRDAAGDWLQVSWQGGTAWLAASLVELDVPVAGLAVATGIVPPPTSAAPSPTPSPATPAQLHCDTVPIRGFGQVWGDHPEVVATLGCPSGYPTAGEIGTDSAVQTFEHGLLLWLAQDGREGKDPVYVLFDTGGYQRFPDLGPADPAVVGTIDAGFFAPGPRFSKVYWEGTGVRVRERLGRATGQQTQTAGAYQQFSSGRMFWNKAVKRIFVLYDYWREDPAARTSVEVRTWTSFEDTFGQ
jgi:hypothetical protein